MSLLGRAALLVAFLAAGAGARPDSGGPGVASANAGDVRKAKSYLKEVKRHLLESYIDRDRMKEDRLVAAALKGMLAALDQKDFAGLEDEARSAAKEALRGAETLEEALEAVDRKASGVDLIRLADHGTQAMVRETGDPYSRVLTDQEISKLLKMLQGSGREESAGCALQVKDGRTTILYVQFGYPAYEEGLEIGDQVLEIRGKKVSELKMEDLNELLRLPVGDTLELKVRRRDRDYVFHLAQRRGAIPDVRFQYLGQGVGYLRLTMFDMSLVREVGTALKKMAAAGMKGVILDLRHNPGGALPAATGVADLFLPQGLLITRTVSYYRPSLMGIPLPGFGGDMEFTTKTKSDFETLPMVCLINRASASASELLAGALKDHRRAVLVGETTFGKGVGQTPIVLSSMLMKRFLYLTVLRYTSPNGGQVDGKGIAPHIEFAEDRPDAEKFDAIWALRRSGELEKYLDAHWGEALKKLAETDAFETGRYEGFDAFHGGLHTTLTPDEVREELRRATRRRMTDQGTNWICDLQTDKVLQRGLVELMDILEKKD